MVEWTPWLKHMRPDCREADTPLHCTIKYDKGGEDQEFAQMWEEMGQGQMMDIKTMDIVSGPQGVAAMIKLPDRIMNWYQEENAAPHGVLVPTSASATPPSFWLRNPIQINGGWYMI